MPYKSSQWEIVFLPDNLAIIIKNPSLIRLAQLKEGLICIRFGELFLLKHIFMNFRMSLLLYSDFIIVLELLSSE